MGHGKEEKDKFWDLAKIFIPDTGGVMQTAGEYGGGRTWFYIRVDN